MTEITYIHTSHMPLYTHYNYYTVVKHGQVTCKIYIIIIHATHQ